jgi:hypothetical protein
MYVKLLNALSICETAPAFFVMKSPYMSRYDRTLPGTLVRLPMFAEVFELIMRRNLLEERFVVDSVGRGCD